MKKVYRFRIEDARLILENTSNPSDKFLVEIDKLQFDTKSFYEAIFSDVNEHIEIQVEKDSNVEKIEDLKIRKIAWYVYDTILLIVDQVCFKLNEDCFGKTSSC